MSSDRGIMKIEILGTGCAKCKMLEKNIKTALSETGIEAEVEKVEESNKIIAYGVFITPALVINGNAVSSGQILTVDEIKAILKKHG